MAEQTVEKSKADWILEWAKEHGEEFTGADAATYLNVESHHVGSAIRGLVSKGELVIGQPREGKRTYSLPPTPELGDVDLADLARPEFIPNLKQSLADRLAVLHEERNKLDAKLRAVDDEAGKIRAGFAVLNAS